MLPADEVGLLVVVEAVVVLVVEVDVGRRTAPAMVRFDDWFSSFLAVVTAAGGPDGPPVVAASDEPSIGTAAVAACGGAVSCTGTSGADDSAMRT